MKRGLLLEKKTWTQSRVLQTITLGAQDIESKRNLLNTKTTLLHFQHSLISLLSFNGIAPQTSEDLHQP